MVSIIIAQDGNDLNDVRELFREYLEYIGFDTDKELIGFPNEYFHAGGRLFLAKHEDTAVGCVGMTQFDNGICEVHRLFVKVKYQGRGIGKKLMEKFFSEAQKIGYDTIKLYTLPKLQKAIDLYLSLGFAKIKTYRKNMYEETIFMKKELP